MTSISIRIFEAKDLLAVDKNGLSDPYVLVLHGKKKVLETPCVKKSLSPQWHEKNECSLKGLTLEDTIDLEVWRSGLGFLSPFADFWNKVWDKNLIGKKFIGKYSVRLADVKQVQKNHTVVAKLLGEDGAADKPRGTLSFVLLVETDNKAKLLESMKRYLSGEDGVAKDDELAAKIACIIDTDEAYDPIIARFKALMGDYNTRADAKKMIADARNKSRKVRYAYARTLQKEYEQGFAGEYDVLANTTATDPITIKAAGRFGVIIYDNGRQSDGLELMHHAAKHGNFPGKVCILYLEGPLILGIPRCSDFRSFYSPDLPSHGQTVQHLRQLVHQRGESGGVDETTRGGGGHREGAQIQQASNVLSLPQEGLRR